MPSCLPALLPQCCPLWCSFSSEAEDPLLWASTYQAGAHLQALAAAAAPQGQPPLLGQQPLGLGFSSSAQRYGAAAAVSADPRKAAVQGYKAQSRRVLEHVDHLLTGCEARRQSVVLEGVHLSLRWVGGWGWMGAGWVVQCGRWPGKGVLAGAAEER